METKDIFQSFYQAYQESFKEIEANHTFPEYFYDLFLAGKATIYQKNIEETKTFDEEWIRTVESYFPSLNKIALDPKSVLRYDEEVVAVEKARKVNSQSIRHLASNTHNIKEVTEDGRVIPKKILTTFAEVEYGTYENRMVMTLIDKLFHFVRHRYEIIKNNVESFQKKHFNLAGDFKFQDKDAKINIDIVLKEDLDNKEINEYNQNLLQRVEHLDKLVTSLKTGSFMRMMEGQKKVYPPIIKSNVILKNVDYKNAYMLWLFLDRYNTLAFDLDIKEKDLTFDQNYLQEVYQSTLVYFATVLYNQENRKEVYDAIKPRKYVRPSIKVIRRLADSVINNPDDFEVEDHTLNEYYLKQFKSYFKKSLIYHEAQAKTYETSLKRALRDTLQITNSLYESFFEMDEEDDIFKRLIKDQDPVVELREAKEKALVAKMIREVKEVDYNDALRLEKRMLTKIAKLDKKLIDASKQNKLLTSKKVRSVESLKHERKLATKRKNALELKLKTNKLKDTELANLRKKTTQEINDLVRKLEKEEQKELIDYKVNLKKQYEVELQKLQNDYQAKLDKINEERRLQKEKLLKQKEERIKREREKAKEKLRIAKEKEKDKQALKLQKEKEKLDKKLKTKKEAKVSV
ncbi:hypothetical protein [Acholeplasma hippikon]|nr:hypothetical protein [Acholeplasma hippikon]